MSRKLVSLCILIFAATLTAGAQEPSKLLRFGRKMLSMATAPSASLDSAYVLQPRLKWMVAVDGNTIHTGVDLHSDLTVSDFTGNNASITRGTMDIGMSNSLYKKVGVAAGYGSLSAGYGVEVGKKSAYRNTYFTFGSIGSFYGFNIQYYKTHQDVTGCIELGKYGTFDLSSAYPGEMRNFTLSGFYGFNRHKFVLASAYAGRQLQRRSAGSWLVAAKYLQGDFSIDPADLVLTALLNDLHRYSTQQVSLGGGYSFNWVLFHREPNDYDTWKGLRNLTLNATLLPMVSFFNHIQTEQGEGNAAKKVRYNGQPTITPTVFGAVCYAWNGYHISVQAGYNRFSFNGADTDVEEEGGHFRTQVRTQGVFYDLSTNLKFGIRF